MERFNEIEMYRYACQYVQNHVDSVIRLSDDSYVAAAQESSTTRSIINGYVVCGLFSDDDEEFYKSQLDIVMRVCEKRFIAGEIN